jgi:hypothetical protein
MEIDLATLDPKCKEMLVHINFCSFCKELLMKLARKEIASKGGSTITPAKSEASRMNQKKGGRKKKSEIIDWTQPHAGKRSFG